MLSDLNNNQYSNNQRITVRQYGNKKSPSSHERMGFHTKLPDYRRATPLSIISGPEVLRPTFSRGLPFSCVLIIGEKHKKLKEYFFCRSKKVPYDCNRLLLVGFL